MSNRFERNVSMAEGTVNVDGGFVEHVVVVVISGNGHRLPAGAVSIWNEGFLEHKNRPSVVEEIEL